MHFKGAGGGKDNGQPYKPHPAGWPWSELVTVAAGEGSGSFARECDSASQRPGAVPLTQTHRPQQGPSLIGKPSVRALSS